MSSTPSAPPRSPPIYTAAITFPAHYGLITPHPIDPRITGEHYAIVEAADETEGRKLTFAAFGRAWAFHRPLAEVLADEATWYPAGCLGTITPDHPVLTPEIP